MFLTRLSSRRFLSHAAALTGLLTLTCASIPGIARAAGRIVPGHIPAAAAAARVLGRLAPAQPMSLALTLPVRDQAGLDDLLTRLYTPGDPLYHKFLTPGEFTDRFAPTATDYGKVITFARRNGLTIIGTHSNRMVVDVKGTSSLVEKAFGLHLMQYKGTDGRVFYAPDREPTVPDVSIAPITGIVGLDNAAVFHSHARLLQPDAVPHGGTGPNGGLAPSDIKTAYSLSGTSLTGSGQTLGLFELDGYKSTDITKYESQFSLPAVTLTNTLIDGSTGSAGSGKAEVTLDIELQIALAPSATKIIVYEAPNSNAGVVDLYNKIASDNLAKEISSSWGEYEGGNTTSALNSENTAFQQMATQGQSIFAAAGDSGADDNGSSLSVDDPASQPYVTGVGGTTLTSGTAGAYVSESTWNGGSVSNGAGGGGISSVWSIPSYQSGVVSVASKGSTTMRNVPDVSLNADPNTGYAIYVGGAWNIYGGTSCAAPLWSAFTALVNQQRVANGSGLIGFANPSIYSTAKGTHYGADFHDIADNSTNLYYPAVTGYDDATGWGTFKGSSLLTDLAGGTTQTPDFSIAASPTSVSVAQGGTGTSTITVGALSGFTGTVTLSASGLPSGVTAAFSPASITTSGTSTLTFTASSTATVGTVTVTITGVSGSTTHTTTVSLTVTATATPNFSIAASPTSVSVVQGATGTSTITIGAANGFTGTVALTASGLPSGVTAAFNPTSVTTSGTSTLTFTASSTATVGTVTVTVTGVSGSLTHTATISLTITSSGGGITQLLGNPGFETGAASPWVASSGVINSDITDEPAHSGSYDAWLDGYGQTHTDTLYQQVAVPSGKSTATLTFWLHIDTAETTKTTAYDTLKVEVRNSSGTVLATLATYSNLNAASGYTQKTFNLSSYIGQTIQVYLVGSEDSSLQTSFVVDDFALNVQ